VPTVSCILAFLPSTGSLFLGSRFVIGVVVGEVFIVGGVRKQATECNPQHPCSFFPQSSVGGVGKLGTENIFDYLQESLSVSRDLDRRGMK
jgi:hypothetical protein